ncbi:hypothetical protein FFV08_10770 [Streptococcus sanguinis]|uniref:Amidohydrolase-related domain-containing protein n=1 Tax=Streptococcus sanguinis TaxID=1305 RepID=A0A7H8VA34_STRSA|nr:hypothetical protein FFV08_10770 [Streptococcus sanguinis]
MFDGLKIYENVCVVIDGKFIKEIRYIGDEDFIDTNYAKKNIITCNFLMPGLIDAHVHITGYSERFLGVNPYLPIENFLNLLVSRGITSVRDTGNSVEAIQYARKWCERNFNIKISFSGPILDCWPITWQFSRLIDTEEEAKENIKSLKSEGVDFIKVYKNIDERLLRNIVKISNEENLYVAIDNPNITTEKQLKAGVKTIEHISNVLNVDNSCSANLYQKLENVTDKQLEVIIELFKKNKAYLCPTILTVSRLLDPDRMIKEPNLKFMSTVMPYHKYLEQMKSKVGYLFGKKYMQESLKLDLNSVSKGRVKEAINKLNCILKKMSDSGVKLLMGTDTPNPSIVPGFSLHDEMVYWEEIGIDRVDILKTVTFFNSNLISDNIGKIQVGMKADLLLLNQNPLDSMENIKDIKCVIVEGKFVDQVNLKDLDDD